MKNSRMEIHTDGGARGNPGPAASAFVVDIDGEEIFTRSKFLGISTNNQAEYTALIMALEWLTLEWKKYGSEVGIFMDSELIIKQMKGIYKVKDEKLKKLYEHARGIIKNISIKIDFIHVPRSHNKRADLLVNNEMDSH